MAAAPTKPALQGSITQTAQVKPNSYSPPGPLGNTTGIIVPDTETSPGANSAPAITPTEKEESWWKRWGSDVVHGALDVAGFVPVLGAIPDVINAGVYGAEGDYVQAGISLVAAVPGAGDAVAAGNIAVKAGKQVEKQIVKQAEKQAEKQVEKQTEKEIEKEAEKKASKDKGGKDKGNPRCILRPYKPDTCKPARTGHHVVPDRVFRTGTRGSAPINGGFSENDGLVICVDGANVSRSREHGQIHALYDPAEAAAGLLGKPPGTAKLGVLEAAGAIAAAKITGCNALLLEAQLRAYHQSRGLGFDTIVRADPSGKLPINPANVGVGAVPFGGATR